MLSPTRRTSWALINWLMLCSASFFLKGGLGPLLKLGLFNAKLYRYFFYYLLFKFFYSHAAQIALPMFTNRNFAFCRFFFAYNKHIRDFFDFSIADLPPYLFVSKINQPANIGIF